MSNQSTDLMPHLAATYGMALFFAGIAAFVFWYVATNSMPLGSRVVTILGGAALLCMGVGSLAGVGVGRFDHYWDTHQAPWPGAQVFTGIGIAIFVIAFVVGWIFKWTNKSNPPDWSDM